jgi:hypothetical protein
MARPSHELFAIILDRNTQLQYGWPVSAGRTKEGKRRRAAALQRIAVHQPRRGPGGNTVECGGSTPLSFFLMVLNSHHG